MCVFMLYRCLPELEMPFVKFMSFLTSLTLNRVDVVVIDVFRECLDLMLAVFSLRAAEDSSLCKCKCKCFVGCYVVVCVGVFCRFLCFLVVSSSIGIYAACRM